MQFYRVRSDAFVTFVYYLSHTSTSSSRASPPLHAHSHNVGHDDDVLNSDFIMDLPPPPPEVSRMVPPPPPRGAAAPPQRLSSMGLSSFSSSSPDDVSKNLRPGVLAMLGAGGGGESTAGGGGFQMQQHAPASLHFSVNHSSASSSTLHRDISPPANGLSYVRGGSSTRGGEVGGGGAPSAYSSFLQSRSPPVGRSSSTSAYNDFRVHL